MLLTDGDKLHEEKKQHCTYHFHICSTNTSLKICSTNCQK